MVVEFRVDPLDMPTGSHYLDKDLLRRVTGLGVDVAADVVAYLVDFAHDLIDILALAHLVHDRVSRQTRHQRIKYELSDVNSRFDDWAALLFEQAQLAEGGQLDDPAGFVKRMNALMLALSSK